MDALIDMIGLGPLGPVIVLGAAGIALVLGAAILMLRAPEDPYAKLAQSGQANVMTGSKKDRLRYDGGSDKLEKYSKFLEPQDAEEFSAVKLRLIQAGYRGKNSVRTYYFFQFALGLGLLALGAILVLIQSNGEEQPSIQAMLITGLGPGIAGYMIPKYWVTKRIQKRQEEITNGFPDSLDMMLVCVEAGQSLDQSIIRVSGELEASFPALAEEFAIVAHEMKAGKDKTAVLRDMSERAGVPDVASFVTVLIQSQQFGTSIAEALRVYAGEMRDKRVMRAEEKANTLPTKMTLATMMLTVPPLLIIMIGPSVYEIYLTLAGGGASVQEY
ncbi:MAG: type II secretion system F family protein [Pseudomonadota bacterium]